VIVFKYGEWSHIENRGVFTGAKPVPDTFVDDIQTRVFPPDVLDAEYELAAFAPAATRIIEWMSSVQAWTVDGDEWELPTDAWTQRVTALAHDVVCAAESDSQLESRVGRRLLESAFGHGDFTNDLNDSGINSLDDDDPRRRSKVVEALFRSGFNPSTEPWLEEDAKSASQLFAKIQGGWDVMPFNPSEANR
jgi:hypothetical protein